jgi:hypothetical protein
MIGIARQDHDGRVEAETMRISAPRHSVASVHGAAYGKSPYPWISTATADDELLEGLKRIRVFCEGLH